MIVEETSVRARLARTGVRAFAVLAGSCALGLACIPSATAKRSSETSAASTSGQTTTQASSTTETTGSTQPASTTPTKRHDGSARKGQTSTSTESSTPATGTDSTGTKTPAGTSRHTSTASERHAKSRPGHSKRSRAGAGEQAAGEQPEEEARGESEAEAQTQSVTGLARSTGGRKKSGKGHKKEGAGGSGKHKKGKSGQEEQETESESGKPETSGKPAPSPTLSSSPPAEALVPAAAPAPVAQEPAPQTTPGVGIAKPSHVARRAHHRRARHRAPKRAGVASVAAAAGASAVRAHAAAGKHARHARRGQGSPHGGGGGTVAPLVRSITKIVEVVPTAVRALIAALLALALGLGLRSWLSTLRARRLERQRTELLDDVGLLQAALLPTTPQQVGPVETSAAYQPAAGPAAGGDFYDVFELTDGQLAVIVGDISGHGRQALPHTALVRFTLRAYLEAGLSPRDALQTAGAVLERQLGGVFATVVVATYDPGERVLVYACAGHPPPALIGTWPDAHSLRALTVCTAPPIGVGMRTGTRQTSVSLPGRTQVCFYTDGVTEARIDHELFGVERLHDALIELGPRASASAVLEYVAGQVDARPDDMAACVLSMPGGHGTPTVIIEELELDRAEASSTRTASFLRACGVPDGELAEVLRSASAAAGRAGTVVLEVRRREQGAASSSPICMPDVPRRSKPTKRRWRNERRASTGPRCGDGPGDRLHGSAVRAHARRRGRALVARAAPARSGWDRAASAGGERGAARRRG